MKKIEINMKIEIDQTLKQEMLDKFYSNPKAVKYVKQLGISDEAVDKYIDRIYDFVLDLEYCDKCPGIKNCQKDNPLLCTKLKNVNGIVDRELTPCKHVLKKIEADEQFIISDFDPEWLEATKADVNFLGKRPKLVNLFSLYSKGEYNGWIYIIGGANSGRSFITTYLCNKVIAAKNLGPICFINFPERIKQLSDYTHSKEKDKFDKAIELYSTVPVLVLDDFGNGYISDYIRDAIIQPILAKRAQKRLLTIFTSDFSIDEVATLLTTNQNAGALRAEQIRKLIKGMSGETIDLGNLPIY